MLLSSTAIVTWNSRNKRYYENLGYIYTKMKDTFVVDVQDLSPGSTAMVLLKCDYCGKEYEIMWQQYVSMRRKSIIRKDACADCCEIKAEEAIIDKYDSYEDHYYKTNDKRKETNLKKYGCENPFGNPDIQQKIRDTNLERYGVEYNMQNPDIVKKGQQTCLEKYGVTNYGKIYSETHRKEKSPTWRGGTEYSRNERASFEYNDWRRSVFSRDKYTCQKCGAKSGNGKEVTLAAHHIQNWRDNEPVRYDIENGITLCEDCHKAFHSQYGKRFNTPEQLDEFIHEEKIDEKIC